MSAFNVRMKPFPRSEVFRAQHTWKGRQGNGVFANSSQRTYKITIFKKLWLRCGRADNARPITLVFRAMQLPRTLFETVVDITKLRLHFCFFQNAVAAIDHGICTHIPMPKTT